MLLGTRHYCYNFCWFSCIRPMRVVVIFIISSIDIIKYCVLFVLVDRRKNCKRFFCFQMFYMNCFFFFCILIGVQKLRCVILYFKFYRHVISKNWNTNIQIILPRSFSHLSVLREIRVIIFWVKQLARNAF